jgi:hypothetical protein
VVTLRLLRIGRLGVRHTSRRPDRPPSPRCRPAWPNSTCDRRESIGRAWTWLTPGMLVPDRPYGGIAQETVRE